MATIYNSNLSKELIDGAKIQISKDSVPNQIADKVVPVMEVNPKLMRIAQEIGLIYAKSTTGSLNAVNARNQDGYITALQISNVQSAASDNVLITVTGTINGASTPLYRRNKPTLTACDTFEHIIFNPPVKIDRNTAVVFSLSFTVGTSISDVQIFGYFDEVSAA